MRCVAVVDCGAGKSAVCGKESVKATMMMLAQLLKPISLEIIDENGSEKLEDVGMIEDAYKIESFEKMQKMMKEKLEADYAKYVGLEDCVVFEDGKVLFYDSVNAPKVDFTKLEAVVDLRVSKQLHPEVSELLKNIKVLARRNWHQPLHANQDEIAEALEIVQGLNNEIQEEFDRVLDILKNIKEGGTIEDSAISEAIKSVAKVQNKIDNEAYGVAAGYELRSLFEDIVNKTLNPSDAEEFLSCLEWNNTLREIENAFSYFKEPKVQPSKAGPPCMVDILPKGEPVPRKGFANRGIDFFENTLV